MRRLCLALSCVLLITVAVRAKAYVADQAPVAQAATTQKPAPAPTPAQANQAKPAPIQPGYVGSAACLTCHDQEEKLKGTPHWQAENPRSPMATHGCESCHGPGKAHIDDENKGNIRKFKQMKADEVTGTCLSC